MGTVYEVAIETSVVVVEGLTRSWISGGFWWC